MPKPLIKKIESPEEAAAKAKALDKTGPELAEEAGAEPEDAYSAYAADKSRIHEAREAESQRTKGLIVSAAEDLRQKAAGTPKQVGMKAMRRAFDKK
jgi:hypothetical protein